MRTGSGTPMLPARQHGLLTAAYAALLRLWQSSPVGYVLVLFLATRLVLTIIGVVSRLALQPLLSRPVWEYSPHLWLSIWGVWDTGRYLEIASQGYSSLPSGGRAQPNYAFFPLYPLLMRMVGWATGDAYVAGLVVSNLALLAGAVFLHKMITLDSDDSAARRTIMYLFLFPSAFVLSGVFAEALLFALSVGCLYSARQQRWLLAGMVGLLAALARQVGVLLFVPLVYEYFRTRHGRPSRVGLDGLALLLVPLGFGVFAFYSYLLTGDLLGVLQIRGLLGERLRNPLEVLVQGLFYGRLHLSFTAAFAGAALVLLSAHIQRLGFSFWFWATAAILVPMSTGLGALLGMPRYLAPLFPLHMALASLGKRSSAVDQVLIISLALLQGFLMVFWTNGSLLMI